MANYDVKDPKLAKAAGCGLNGPNEKCPCCA